MNQFQILKNSLITCDKLYDLFIIKHYSIDEITKLLNFRYKVIKQALNDFNLYRCNFCFSTQDLIKDKNGRIYNLCKSCSSLKSKEGTDKQKNTLLKKVDGIIFSKSNFIIKIEEQFLMNNIINLRKSLEEISNKYNISYLSLKKFCKIYNIKEIKKCNKCNTSYNLITIKNKKVKCCIDCWEKSYKNRIRKKKNIIKNKCIATSGIGIRAQYFFRDLEYEINKNFLFKELKYGFYDKIINKRLSTEKYFKIGKIDKLNRKISRGVDFYIKLNNDREIVIEYDEDGHFNVKSDDL